MGKVTEGWNDDGRGQMARKVTEGKGRQGTTRDDKGQQGMRMKDRKRV